MDWELAIKRNHEALQRIVALLFAILGNGAYLPRASRNAAFRILRPAESAVRRLIVIAARGINPPNISITSKMPNFSCFSANTKHVPSFRLYDPRKRFVEAVTRLPVFTPRISVPNYSNPIFKPAAEPLEYTLDSAPLKQRLLALKEALDDLPKQAQRLARSNARRSLLPAGP